MEGSVVRDTTRAVDGGRVGGRSFCPAETLQYQHCSRPSPLPAPDDVRRVGVLGDGTPVSVRPLVAADRAWFAQWTAALSDQSKYRRFFSCHAQLPARMLDQLVDDVDGVWHAAFVAMVPALPAFAAAPPSWPDAQTVPVAVGRFIRLRTDSTVAEVAYTVTDAWQGRGVGTLLMQALVIAAGALGVTAFTATVLAENQPSLRLLQRAGRVTRREANGTEVELDVELSVLPAPTKRRGPTSHEGGDPGARAERVVQARSSLPGWRDVIPVSAELGTGNDDQRLLFSPAVRP